MPATPAVRVLSHRTIDTASIGMEDATDGLLVSSVSNTVTSNLIEHMGGQNQAQVMIWNNIKLQSAVTAKLLDRASAYGYKLPGTCIHPNNFGEVTGDTSFEFDLTAGGYWVITEPKGDGVKGDFDDYNFNAVWWEDASLTPTEIAAPSA